jgi:hypothetical protein
MTREHFEEDQRQFRDAAKAPDEGKERGGIGWAVKQLLQGATVARRGWNGKGMHLYYVAPHEVGESEFLGFVVMVTVDAKHVPWLCSQTDLLAIDWEIVNAAPKVTPHAE